MEHLRKINIIQEKLESLKFDKSQLEHVNKFTPKMDKNKAGDIMESTGTYLNEDEATRIKICLQNIFLNRIQNTEKELRSFNITENGL